MTRGILVSSWLLAMALRMATWIDTFTKIQLKCRSTSPPPRGPILSTFSLFGILVPRSAFAHEYFSFCTLASQQSVHRVQS
jgi:hypothetical protein